MDYVKVLEKISDYVKQDIDLSFYNKIKLWRDWYLGYVDGFHRYKQKINGKYVERKRYGLKIASKVCRDWASILCNERTQILIDDEKSNEFIQGKDGFGGILGENNFWIQANYLIEKAFALGTSATDIYFENLSVDEDGNVIKDGKAKAKISYIVADNIIPLSWENGEIREVAFVSNVFKKGKEYVYVRIHTLEDDGYVIKNRYFEKLKGGDLRQVPVPEGMLEEFRTKSFIKLFSIWKPNIVNTINLDSPLGISILDGILDNLEGIDYAYDNLCQDFFLGGKMVFMNGTMFDKDDTPAVYSQESVFRVMGDAVLEGKNAYYEYNPLLRVDENKKGIEAQLDYISLLVGFGTRHYRFSNNIIQTATEYNGEKQDLIHNAQKHNMIIEKAIYDIVKALLWFGKEILGLDVKVNANITFVPDKSYITDEESDRQFDLLLVKEGIMKKWEWRMKYYGESEEAAKKIIDKT